jgi:hypothetical protein
MSPRPAAATAALRARTRAAALAGALVTGALAAAPAAAQQTLPPAPAPAQLPWLQTVSINPVGIVGGIFSAEYEVALPAPGFTVAAGGSIISDAFLVDRNQRWVSGRVMYYPQEVSLRGLAVGVSLGVHGASRGGDDDPARVRRRDTGATLGLVGSYNWLVGRQQRLLFGAGAGLKRVLKNVGDDSPLQQIYPDGRLLLGFAF